VDADPDLAQLAAALADVGRAVRRAVLGVPASPADAAVLRSEGGDVVFGVDGRADVALREAIAPLGARWPGRLVMEGFDDPLPLGGRQGPWTYLVDPVDGTRPWLAGKRSAWVLLGAGRDASTLEDLEVGAAVELPTVRARVGLVAFATRDGGLTAVDDHLATGARVPAPLAPRRSGELDRTFVTVARFSPGDRAAIGAWEDRVLAGWETYEDPYLCSGGQMMGLALGQDAAVLDPRPLLGSRFCAHPYDLAALVVARAAGVLVEAIPPGPLDVPLDLDTDVAWAGYANADVAALLRARLALIPPASGLPAGAGTG
jgi:fructose-1,6-bisphosphatase/inositol monophosphatase family enzyme